MKKEEILRAEIIKQYGTIRALADKINKPASTISNLLNRSVDNAGSGILCLICEALNIDIRELILSNQIKERTYTGYRLTNKEENLIEKYRALDDFGINAVDSILGIETDRNIYYDNKIKYIYKPLTYQSAAAGFGDIISDQDYEMVKLPRTSESELADFVIRVTGDSMEPTYFDRDCVLIRKQASIYDGDIGLFVYQGDVFIKVWNNGELMSLNPQYEPIKITDLDSFQSIGKVIGKTEVIKE